MSILSSLAMKAGVKGLGVAADAASSIVSAAGKAARGIASGVKNISDAAANTQDEQGSPGKVINNVGIVGSAGAQKVKTGGGTLPATKKAAKPAYNQKMPTEKLLNVAVNYLASIDASLRTQIENDRVAYQKQAQAEKEAAIENKDSAFKKLGDRLGGDWMDKKPSNDMAKKLLLGGALVAGLGAIGISKLDTTELDALKANVAAFKREYSWLTDMASFIGVGGFLGFLRGGVRGGLIGIVAEYVVEKLWYSPLNPMQPKDENGNPIEAPSSAGKGALLAGAGAYGLAKSIGKAAPKIAAAKQLGNVVKSGSVVEIQKATRRGTTWFASKRGRKFLIILGRKLGKGMMKKIGIILARIVGSVLLAGTGIGAIPGIISIIFNAGILLYGIYDIATAIWDAWNESQADASPTNNAAATAVSGNTVTGGTASAAPGSGGEGQESFVPSGDQKVDFAMQYLMKNLGLKQFQAAGIVANLMAESELDTNAFNDAGGGRGAYGIAQWRGPRQDGLDAFAASRGKRRDDFETQLAWIVQEMKTTHKDTLPAIQATTSSADATTVFLDKYERPSAADRASSLKKRISYGMAAERGTSLQTAQSTYEEPAALAAQSRGASGGGDISSMLSMAKKIFGKAGGALVGAQNYKPREITENVGAKISDISKNIEAVTIAGNEPEVAKAGAVAATAAQKSIMQASNDGSLTALDPNYPDGADTIMKYLAHWKFAA